MSDKEKVQQILTKYTISELVECHIEAVDRINKAIEYIEQEECNTEYDKKLLDILRGVNYEKENE